MIRTKNQLDYERVVLDYEAMLKTASFAVRELANHSHKFLSEIIYSHFYENINALYLNASRLEDTSKELLIASETYVALKEGLKRKEIEIINRIKQEEENKK